MMITEKMKTIALIVMAGIIVMMSLWIAYRELSTIPLLRSNLSTMEAKKQLSDGLLKAQNAAIEENAVDEYEVAQIPIRVEKITRELVPIKEEIIKWRDSNASDCNVSRLYGFDFRGVFNAAMLASDRESTREGEDRNATAPEYH